MYMSKASRVDVRSALHSWRALNAVLTRMDESDVMHAIKIESAQPKPRITVLSRLRKRLAAVKTADARNAASIHVLKQ